LAREGRALDLEDDFFIFPGDIGNSANRGEGRFHGGALSNAGVQGELEAEVLFAFAALAAVMRASEVIKVGLFGRAAPHAQGA
jgi:hypothetical protein